MIMGDSQEVNPARPGSNPLCDCCPLKEMFREDFPKTLNRLLKKSGLKPADVARRGVKPPYLSRLRTGEKRNPGWKIVLKLCNGLSQSPEIENYDLDELLMSTGYAPIFAVDEAL